jgi:hypothetical protein
MLIIQYVYYGHVISIQKYFIILVVIMVIMDLLAIFIWLIKVLFMIRLLGVVVVVVVRFLLGKMVRLLLVVGR